MDVLPQIYPLIILSFAIASIAWTVTQEQIFREPRDWCSDRSETASNIFARKFFYVWTCEYCFSHWVTVLMLILTGFRLLIDDWRGYVIAFFVLAWISNQWMSLYRRLRVEIKKENRVAKKLEKEIGD